MLLVHFLSRRRRANQEGGGGDRSERGRMAGYCPPPAAAVHCGVYSTIDSSYCTASNFARALSYCTASYSATAVPQSLARPRVSSPAAVARAGRGCSPWLLLPLPPPPALLAAPRSPAAAVRGGAWCWRAPPARAAGGGGGWWLARCALLPRCRPPSRAAAPPPPRLLVRVSCTVQYFSVVSWSSVRRGGGGRCHRAYFPHTPQGVHT